MIQPLDSIYTMKVGGFFEAGDNQNLSLGTAVYLLDRNTNTITGAIEIPSDKIVGVNKYALAASDSGPFTNLSEYNILYGNIPRAGAIIPKLNAGEIVFIKDNKPYCFRTPLEVIELREGMPKYMESFTGAILPHHYRNLYDVGDVVAINAVPVRRMRKKKAMKDLNLKNALKDGVLNFF